MKLFLFNVQFLLVCFWKAKF